LGCPNFFGEHICDVQGGTPVHLEEEGVKSFESLQLPKDGGTSSLDGRKKRRSTEIDDGQSLQSKENLNSTRLMVVNDKALVRL
jgi:hypothetical protein